MHDALQHRTITTTSTAVTQSRSLHSQPLSLKFCPDKTTPTLCTLQTPQTCNLKLPGMLWLPGNSLIAFSLNPASHVGKTPGIVQRSARPPRPHEGPGTMVVQSWMRPHHLKTRAPTARCTNRHDNSTSSAAVVVVVVAALSSGSGSGSGTRPSSTYWSRRSGGICPLLLRGRL